MPVTALGSGLVRARRDPPQAGLAGLLVEIGGRGRVRGAYQVLPELAQVIHAPRRSDQLPGRQRSQRRRARLLQVPGRQVRVGQHHRGEEITPNEPGRIPRRRTLTGAQGRIGSAPEVAQAAPELGGELGLVEILEPVRVIFWPAPLELPYRLRQPFVVAVNCFDGAQRFEPDDIRIALSLGPGVPIVLCDARQRDSVKKVLVSLVRYVLSTGSRASQISIA